jgi:phospholipid N-methyltransferase
VEQADCVQHAMEILRHETIRIHGHGVIWIALSGGVTDTSVTAINTDMDFSTHLEESAGAFMNGSREGVVVQFL